MHGFCHIEIPAKDHKRLGKFYADIFGWEIKPFTGMDYTVFKPNEGVGGGFDTQSTPSSNGGVTLYIETENIDDVLKKVIDNGGKVIKPKYAIPNVGHIALFTDTDGNKMGLWSK